jgi:transketolase|tara:strand:- start:1859 stop:2707 length:849 start_codon:yes stop_codon:yes gene_type:complete
VNENIIKKIDNFSLNIRRNILEMAYVAGASSSHLGGALSIVEIISTLFTTQINIDNKNPNWVNKDRFILSKGHACLAYYSALSEVGFITKKELKTFEKDGSNLLGHPVLNKKMGIDFSNGSLGMGLSLGIGVAISLKKKKKNFNVYVVMGDGECNEGSVWEAAMAAPNFKLDNLYAIIDKNNFQQTGSNKEIMNVESLKDKWQSFGWQTTEIDGHNIEELYDYFEKNKEIKKPKALIANTIKGKGFSFSENNNDWHHAVLTKSLYETAMSELIKNKPYGNKR